MRNSIAIELACNPGEWYAATAGATLTSEYGETLDSMSIVLDGVPASRRLTALEPYQWALVKNEDDTGMPLDDAGDMERQFLVDSYQERLTNVAQGVYQYTISLMSETKLLEKAQCPNLTITHDISGQTKTVYDYIAQCMALYCPKVKTLNSDGATWSYKPAIAVGPELAAKFTALCADLSMNAPTLRALLTSLMLQQGCLPVVRDRTLSYLDLRATKTAFDASKGVNYVDRSMSSDSFVNALVAMPTQALDAGNDVICETLGFRDRGSVLIKQESNLKLETAFPIYRVDYFAMRPYCRVNQYFLSAVNMGAAATIEGSYGGGALTVTMAASDATLVSYIKVHWCHYDAVGDKYVQDSEEGHAHVWVYPGRASSITLAAPSGSTHFWFECSNGGAQAYTPVAAFAYADDAFAGEIFVYASPDSQLSAMIYDYATLDLTPLCVEQGKRNLLDTDFSTMPTTGSIEDLAKWVYGTVGYSVGGKEISGFSAMYSKAVGWWSESKTYIENIYDFVANGSLGISAFPDFDASQFLAGLPTVRAMIDSFGAIVTNPEGALSTNFATLMFDVRYQPLNTLALTFSKAEAPMPIEQFDGVDSGVVDMDRFSSSEQEKADRLGNFVYSISQTTDDQGAAQPLNSEYQGATVFRKAVRYEDNYAQINYAASANHVMQNYFTAITTKYRAYQNVDYSAAVVRKERDLTHVRVGHGSLDGSDRFAGASLAHYMLTGLLGEESAKVRYAYERSGGQACKLDVSATTTKGGMAFATQCYDNASAGTYLTALVADADLGGIPQAWQKWGDGYATAHEVGYVSGIPFYADKTSAGFAALAGEPVITGMAIEPLFTLGAERVYHKDNAEIINETAQFAFYAPDGDFIWTEGLMKACALIADPEWMGERAVVDITGLPFEVSDAENSVGALLAAAVGDVLTLSGAEATIAWPEGVEALKVVRKATAATWRDVAAFKRGSNDVWAACLNDTKTDRVYREQADGLLVLDKASDLGGGRGAI